MGYTTDTDVGDYSLELVGVDDSLELTVVPFMLSVKRMNSPFQLNPYL